MGRPGTCVTTAAETAKHTLDHLLQGMPQATGHQRTHGRTKNCENSPRVGQIDTSATTDAHEPDIAAPGPGSVTGSRCASSPREHNPSRPDPAGRGRGRRTEGNNSQRPLSWRSLRHLFRVDGPRTRRFSACCAARGHSVPLPAASTAPHWTGITTRHSPE